VPFAGRPICVHFGVFADGVPWGAVLVRGSRRRSRRKSRGRSRRRPGGEASASAAPGHVQRPVGVDQCAAPRIDADALDKKVLDCLADFYTTKLDLAREAIAAVRAQHLRARAGHERELAALSEQLANREAIVDRYLTDYEDNTIDRDTVARRIDKISEEIRHLRHRRDEVTYLLDVSADEPDGAHLIQLRDRVTEIINTGAAPARKAICEALIAEVRLNATATVTPVFRVPLTSADARAILGTSFRASEKAVRERPPSVGRTGLEPVTDRL